ncbi:hypothetical protein RHSIM_RhsimUnG0107400 [Rhododendron simsii]|uniref:Uncharacterized protein n=1 Tax=Rhododendron simsii TaxID=118357 RepID=A0A834FYG7_RHOSS|nr:hypothetical protein RHSIM_RhsimUnG0107400 [Rhododendron simsii]
MIFCINRLRPSMSVIILLGTFLCPRKYLPHLLRVTIYGRCFAFAWCSCNYNRPTDLMEVRHSGALNAYSAFVRKAGIGAVARNAIINAAELASYDQVKETILKIPGFTDNVVTRLLSGLGAGFFTVCIGSPVCVVQSRMMGDSSAYKNTVDCFVKTLKNDGPFAFYEGFILNFGRLGSRTMIMFLTLERAKKLFRSIESCHLEINGWTMKPPE